MISDFRYAIRQLAKAPGFTAVAVLTLALGIGACTAIFSVVDIAILNPLPYPHIGRLVRVIETNLPQTPLARVSPPAFEELKKQTTVFESLGAAYFQPHNITGTAEPVRVYTEHVTANFFTTLGVHPLFGRAFQPEEETTGKGNVVILSHRLWKNNFGSRADILNQSILLDDQPVTIIGVMPEDFQSESTNAALYSPIQFTDQLRSNFRYHSLYVVGRIKPDVTLEQVKSEMAVIAGRIAQQHPDTNQNWSASATTLRDDTIGFARPLMFTLLGAVFFLLLIACVNIANLLLARASARQKEIGVRTALGATRWRIVRQLLAESLLLALFGGALGVVLARWGIALMLRISPADLPRVNEISINPTALIFTVILVVLTAFVFGLVPAFLTSKVDLNTTLKDSGARGSSSGGKSQRLRNLLVVTEVALALVLLVSAGLLTRSFVNLQNVDTGMDFKNLWHNSVALTQSKFTDQQSRLNFVNAASEQIARVPGVSTVAFSTSQVRTSAFSIAGRAPAPANQPSTAVYNSVSPDFFKTLGIIIRRGRGIKATDDVKSSPVVVINQEVARLYFPGEDPIGQQIKIASSREPEMWREVVGIVGNVLPFSPDLPPLGAIYLPFAQQPEAYLALDIRTAGGPLDIRAVCTAVHAVEKDVPITTMYDSDNHKFDRGLMAVRRFSMALTTVFSCIALLLAALGIYGVMSYNVAQRTNEIGIRMALGAQTGDVLRLIFSQGGRLVGLGLLIGVFGALIAGRLLGAMLFNVNAYDPVTLILITCVLSLIAFLACWLPARRATKVDPLVALRSE